MTKKELQARDAEWLRIGKQLVQQKDGMRRLGLDPAMYVAFKIGCSLTQAEWILLQLKDGAAEC